MVCVPNDVAKSISNYKSVWNSGNKELDGSNGGEQIELEKNNDTSHYKLNTFRKTGDNINLAIKSKTELNNQDLVCTKYDMYKDAKNFSETRAYNECNINDDKSNCEANPKCAFDSAKATKCNYKSTNIKELLNYSILKIYK